jgi:hypothetical protein
LVGYEDENIDAFVDECDCAGVYCESKYYSDTGIIR